MLNTKEIVFNIQLNFDTCVYTSERIYISIILYTFFKKKKKKKDIKESNINKTFHLKNSNQVT